MATTAKKATLTNVCCAADGGKSAAAVAGVRREAASAFASAVDWSVPSATAEDLQDKKAAAMTSVIRPEPSSNAATKGNLFSLSSF